LIQAVRHPKKFHFRRPGDEFRNGTFFGFGLNFPWKHGIIYGCHNFGKNKNE